MKSINKHNVLALAVLGSVLAVGSAFAEAADYEFQLVDSQIKQSDSAIVAVRLIDKRSGQAVPDAVIVATRMDMAPGGMEMMSTSVEPAPSNEPGVYRFKANLSMAGGWRFSVAAKVQGEAEAIQSKLVLRAVQ